MGVLNRLVLNRLAGSTASDSGAIVSKTPFKTSTKQKRDRGRDSQPRPRPRLNSLPQGATKFWWIYWCGFLCADCFGADFLEEFLAARSQGERQNIFKKQTLRKNPPQIPPTIFASQSSLRLKRSWVHPWMPLHSLRPSVLVFLAKKLGSGWCRSSRKVLKRPLCAEKDSAPGKFQAWEVQCALQNFLYKILKISNALKGTTLRGQTESKRRSWLIFCWFLQILSFQKFTIYPEHLLRGYFNLAGYFYFARLFLETPRKYSSKRA